MRRILRPWCIYLLLDTSGSADYIGATRNLPRRLREHKKDLGYRPLYLVLETGEVGTWRQAEHRWIEHYRTLGHVLRNKTSGKNGAQTHSEESRKLLSVIGRGRAKPPGFGERLSATTRGQARNWSPEGLTRVRAHQFKRGQRCSDAATKANRRYWDSVAPEERSRMARERNLGAWARRTPEERDAIIAKAVATRRRNRKPPKNPWTTMAPEERARRGQISSERMKRVWADRRAAKEADHATSH